MKKQKIVWTLLPNGITPAGNLKFSLHCAPQLQTDEHLPGEDPGRPTLKQFPELWHDWPAVVQKLKFGVQFYPDGTTSMLAKAEPTLTLDDKNSKFWQRVFPPSLYIKPFKFDDYTKQNIYSYPVGNVHQFLKSLYSATAALSPAGYPLKTALWADGQLSKIHFYPIGGRKDTLSGGDQEKLHQAIVTFMQKQFETKQGTYTAHAVPPTPPNPELDFYQLSYFHQPHAKPLPDKTITTKFGHKHVISGGYQRITDAKLKKPDGVHDQDDIDFHGVVGGFGDYPALMRQMGIVIELEVTPPAGFVENSASVLLPAVQPVIEWPSGVTKPDEVRTKTLYHKKGKVFIAKSKAIGGEFDEHGLLTLNAYLPDQQRMFEITQVDIAGGALKLMNTAYGLVQAEARRTLDTSDYSSLPSLQSAGFTISRTGAALALSLSFQDQKKLYVLNPSEPVMSAEDLNRGYRMDVHDSRTKAWHSLYERIGSFDFKLGTPLELEDEGFTQLGVTQAADGSSDDLYHHEHFVAWQGWSLIAPRPGNAMNNAGLSSKPSDLNPTNSYHPNFKPSFKVKPGSLPGLRFGLRYRFRVRGVDLAGNSPAELDPNNFSSVTEEQIYTRFEPIASPPVVLRDKLNQYKPPSPYPTMVSPGESLERIVIRSYNSDPPTMNIVDTTEVATRHFAPPKVGITLTEHHGKLDLPLTVSDWDARDDSAKRAIYNEQFTQVSKLADGAFTDLTFTPPVPPHPTPTPPPDASAQITYSIYPNDKLDTLPYLPDPIAHGVTFIDLPGMGSNNYMHLPGAPALTGLDPYLSKESVTQVDFAFGDAWYNVTGFRIELRDATEAQKANPGKQLVPKWDDSARVLTVYLPKAGVYTVPFSSFIDPTPLNLGDAEPGAAQQPLDAMGMWQFIAAMGLPASQLQKIRKFFMQGRGWTISPFRELALVHAVQKPLVAPSFNKLAQTKYLGDTFATLTDQVSLDGPSTGKVDIRADWNEPVDDLRDPTWKIVKGTAQVVEKKIEEPKSTALLLYDPHNFGDTKHRMVNYTAVGSTRFREYFPPDLTKDEKNIAQYSAPVQISILNSARPTAPDLLYIVPIFGWDRPDGNGKAIAHKRKGNALRVYMNRPWFSSGEGEELGVLVWTDTFNNIPEKYEKYVTQWGMDPIWGGNHPSGSPSLDSFPRHTHFKQDVTLDEVAGVSLDELAAIAIDLTHKAAMTKPASATQNLVIAGVTKSVDVSTSKKMFQNLANAPRGGNASKYLAKEIVHLQYIPKPGLMVVGHAVQFDSVRQLWYSDIEIDAGPSYTPFVRLALTRFQPESVDNAHVSRVILADFAQLLPDRNVAIVFDQANPKLLLVAVSGRTYTSAPTEAESLKPQRGSTMEVAVEMRRPDVTDESEELSWAPVPDATFELQSQVGQDGMGVWTAFVNLPEPRDQKKFRLHFREFEHFVSDVDPLVFQNHWSPQKGKSLERRVVFAETIEI